MGFIFWFALKHDIILEFVFQLNLFLAFMITFNY